MKSIIAASALVFLIATGPSFACFAPIPTAQDNADLVTIHVARTNKERTLIPSLIAMLERKPTANDSVLVEAGDLLADFGATSALPALDDAATNARFPATKNEIVAIKARLIAVSTSGGAKTQTDAFFKTLALTPEQINKGVNANLARNRTDEAYRASFALEELSDLIYHSGRYEEFFKLAPIKQIRFDAYQFTAAELRLAVLPNDQRLAAIIDDLANGHQMTYGEVDLAAEYGLPAGEAAAAKLIEINQDRANHDDHQFVSLLAVIGRVEDKAQKPLIKRFTHDTNSMIASQARYYDETL